MYSRKAEMGIATLVLVTAMILVSAIVFYALTVSVNQVTQESKNVGEQVGANIGTAMTVVKLYAQDGSSGNSVDYFYMEIKPPYASDEINLNESLAVMLLHNDSQEYTYDADIDCAVKDAGDTSSIYHANHATDFGVQYVDGSGTYTDTILGGELVRLCLKSPHSVVKDDRVQMTFYSTVGYAASVDTIYTDIISDISIYFFP